MEVTQKAHKKTSYMYRVVGRISSPTDYKKLEEIFQQRKPESNEPLVIDFSGVTFCTSQALGILVSHARKLKDRGVEFCICNPQDEVKETIEIAGISEILNCIACHSQLDNFLDECS